MGKQLIALPFLLSPQCGSAGAALAAVPPTLDLASVTMKSLHSMRRFGEQRLRRVAQLYSNFSHFGAKIFLEMCKGRGSHEKKEISISRKLSSILVTIVQHIHYRSLH